MRRSVSHVPGYLIAATLALVASAAHAQSTNLAYWDFNGGTTQAQLFTVTSGAEVGNASMSTNFASVTNQAGTTVNAIGADAAGQALALVNQSNNGKYLQFSSSTSGFQNISLNFATQGTGTGFNSDQLSYSTDGTTFNNFGSAYTPASSFATQSFDLSSVTGLNDAATVYFRITFTGASSSSGNNRIDNLQINGAAMPEPADIAFVLVAGMPAVFALSRSRRMKK